MMSRTVCLIVLRTGVVGAFSGFVAVLLAVLGPWKDTISCIMRKSSFSASNSEDSRSTSAASFLTVASALLAFCSSYYKISDYVLVDWMNDS